MEIVHRQCAGLDVHKKTVVATILIEEEQGGLYKETRTFETYLLTTGGDGEGRQAKKRLDSIKCLNAR